MITTELPDISRQSLPGPMRCCQMWRYSDVFTWRIHEGRGEGGGTPLYHSHVRHNVQGQQLSVEAHKHTDRRTDEVFPTPHADLSLADLPLAVTTGRPSSVGRGESTPLSRKHILPPSRRGRKRAGERKTNPAPLP